MAEASARRRLSISLNPTCFQRLAYFMRTNNGQKPEFAPYLLLVSIRKAGMKTILDDKPWRQPLPFDRSEKSDWKEGALADKKPSRLAPAASSAANRRSVMETQHGGRSGGKLQILHLSTSVTGANSRPISPSWPGLSRPSTRSFGRNCVSLYAFVATDCQLWVFPRGLGTCYEWKRGTAWMAGTSLAMTFPSLFGNLPGYPRPV